MREYQKIETLYQRDIDGTKKLIPGKWRDETVEFLKDIPWIWTEKIDGTNIRIYWDGHNVQYGGRTDRAQIPAKLFARLHELFGTNESEQLFEQLFGEREVVLFGEGYGAGIQKGGVYIPDGVDFILFDLLIGDNYQPRTSVEECAKAFGINVVPVLGVGTLEEAEKFVRGKPRSEVGECIIEGVVCRPLIELRDRCNNRLIVKVKICDFG